MERIPSECRIEMTEHERGWQGSAAHRERMLSGIYTVIVKEDVVQVQVMYSILQKQRQWEMSAGGISPQGSVSACVNSAVFSIPVSICLKGIHKPESEYAN